MRQVNALVEQLVRDDQGRMFAAFGEIDMAEDALQDALTTALERRPRDGVPNNPVAWILRTAPQSDRPTAAKSKPRTQGDAIGLAGRRGRRDVAGRQHCW